jgi:ribosomal protein S18 acetylase RimI-like enzyme
MSVSYAITPARPEELAAAFHLLFQHIPLPERRTRIENALRLVASGELNPEGLFVARSPEGLLGVLLCLPVPGASALVWPPQVSSAADGDLLLGSLVRHAHAWLRPRGVKVAQTLLAPQEFHLGAPLLANGFVHVTSLLYLRRFLTAPFPRLSGRLIYRPYAQGDRNLFEEMLARTYEHTLDCPELNGVRDLAEVMEGHRAQGAHDPAHWWLALEADRPVGVLLTTVIPEWRAWDLSYVGVVPEARGRGLGRELTRKALHEAQAAHATQLTLAVDVRNQPARNMYARLGFEATESREVLLAFYRREEVLV